MKKNVLITIKGIQGDLLDSEKIEMMTTGTFYEKNGKYFIHYLDTSLDSETETKTTVKIHDNKVSITRYGGASTHMIFEKGVSHFTPYETPLGIFEIRTHTNSIHIEKQDANLQVQVEYILEINKMSSGVAHFELSARDI